MNTSTIESDFKAARAKTAVTIMNATGWKQGVVNPDCVSVDSVFFYVFDYLIASNEIERSMDQVIAMDSVNHPEWIGQT